MPKPKAEDWAKAAIRVATIVVVTPFALLLAPAILVGVVLPIGIMVAVFWAFNLTD